MGAISPGRWQLTQRFMKMGATFSANVGFSPSAALAAGTAAASARIASAPFKKPGRVSIIGLLVFREPSIIALRPRILRCFIEVKQR
jgi:hypothetical protein